MEYQTITAADLRPLVVMWQRLREEGWELDTSVKHIFNWKRFRFEYKLRVFREETGEYNLDEQALKSFN